MNLYSTNDLKQYIDSMYSKIARIAKQDNVYLDMCTRFEFADVGYPEGEYCFSDGQAYRYRCLERGEMIEDRGTKSIFDITYWATETSIFRMSVNFECKNRLANQDPRRIAFSKRIQYYSLLGEEYEKRAEYDISEALKIAPYLDKNDKEIEMS